MISWAWILAAKSFLTDSEFSDKMGAFVEKFHGWLWFALLSGVLYVALIMTEILLVLVALYFR